MLALLRSLYHDLPEKSSGFSQKREPCYEQIFRIDDEIEILQNKAYHV
jgi:hypothetical protein